MLHLYAHRFDPHSRCVRIALAELDCEYQYTEIDPHEVHPAELQGRTPQSHGVPILHVRSGFLLWDSTAIIHWLAGSFRGSVTPSTRDARARALNWVGWATRRLYEPLIELSGSIVQKGAGERRFRRLLADLEPMMPRNGDRYLIENTFSIADIALAPALVALPDSLVRGLSPRVGHYIDRLRHRESVFEICELGEVGARPSLAS